MSRKVSINVLNTQKVLIAFRVPVSDIPKDARGRSWLQAHERSGGSQASSTSKIIFGGYENPKQKKALFDLPALLGRGFRVNNMYTCSVYKEHKVREDVVNVCLWLDYHKGASRDTLVNEWGDTAARFIVEKLARAYNSATVFDNGDMISVNMIDAMNPDKEADFVLVPRVRLSAKIYNAIHGHGNDTLDSQGRDLSQVLRDEDEARSRIFPHP